MEKMSTICAIYMGTVLICSCVSFVGVLVDVFLHRVDLAHVTTNTRILIPMSNNLWIYLYCRLRQQSIERALDLTDSFRWEDMPTRDAGTGHLTAAGWIKPIKMFSTGGAIAVSAFYCVQAIIRIVKNNETMMVAWYPPGWTASPFYEMVHISQVFTAFLHIGITFGFLPLDITLIAVACTQFDKLNAALLEISQENITFQNEHEYKTVDIFANRSLQDKLNACIRHHQEILTFMQQLEDTLSIALCGHFPILLATMCFSAFSVVTNWGDYENMSLSVLVYSVYCTDVFLLCWFGTHLTLRAESVRDAAFGCDWVGTPISFQRRLMFLIAKANKDFQLTAGKFVPVSNVTMLNIMQETMSFFMFLLHVKSKAEEMR